MEVKVCVGSACHLKGSYDVIESLQSYIKNNKLEEKIDLKASFCLGQCTKNVSVLIDNILYSANKDNIIELIEERVDNI